MIPGTTPASLAPGTLSLHSFLSQPMDITPETSYDSARHRGAKGPLSPETTYPFSVRASTPNPSTTPRSCTFHAHCPPNKNPGHPRTKI